MSPVKIHGITSSDRLFSSLVSRTAGDRFTDVIEFEANGMSQGDRSFAEFDMSTAVSRMNNDPELFREFVRIFLEDAPLLVEEAQTSVRLENTESIRYAAHALKGLSAAVGADSLSESAGTLESSASNNQSSRDILPEVLEKYQRLVTELQEYLSTQSSQLTN